MTSSSHAGGRVTHHVIPSDPTDREGSEDAVAPRRSAWGTEGGGGAYPSTLARTHSKNWPDNFWVTPPIMREARLAMVPVMVTSAVHCRPVLPGAGSVNTISASTSAADPLAVPWARATARSGGDISTHSTSTVKRVLIDPNPSEATALKRRPASTSSIELEARGAARHGLRIGQKIPDALPRRGDRDGSLKVHVAPPRWGTVRSILASGLAVRSIDRVDAEQGTQQSRLVARVLQSVV